MESTYLVFFGFKIKLQNIYFTHFFRTVSNEFELIIGRSKDNLILVDRRVEVFNAVNNGNTMINLRFQNDIPPQGITSSTDFNHLGKYGTGDAHGNAVWNYLEDKFDLENGHIIPVAEIPMPDGNTRKIQITILWRREYSNRMFILHTI